MLTPDNVQGIQLMTVLIPQGSNESLSSLPFIWTYYECLSHSPYWTFRML